MLRLLWLHPKPPPSVDTFWAHFGNSIHDTGSVLNTIDVFYPAEPGDNCGWWQGFKVVVTPSITRVPNPLLHPVMWVSKNSCYGSMSTYADDRKGCLCNSSLRTINCKLTYTKPVWTYPCTKATNEDIHYCWWGIPRFKQVNSKATDFVLWHWQQLFSGAIQCFVPLYKTASGC